MRIVKIIILLLLVSTATFSQSFNESKLLENLQILSSDSMAGRGTGQPGGKMARLFIMEQFEKVGLLTFNDSYLQEFSAQWGDQSLTAFNVVGYFNGDLYPERYIVITAHYDHLGIREEVIYNGADDNGSGTCALFSLAEYYQKHPPNHSIIFVALDAEELGLLGATYFVDNPPIDLEKIVLNVNMDMIGRNDRNEIYIAGTHHYPQLKQFFDENNTPLTVKFGHDGNDDKQDWTYSSDHAAFHSNHIPFLYFGEEDHEDYHRASDTYDGIEPDFYINSVKLILNTINAVDSNY